MTPAIKHLQNILTGLPLPTAQSSKLWNFDHDLKALGSDFYRKVVSLHPMLNLEYSILCNQLHHNFAFPGNISREEVIKQLISALILAELLEHVHQYYLVVPREVLRLRRQKQVYRELLTEMDGYEFPQNNQLLVPVDVGLSLTQRIREFMTNNNMYRLLLARSKRLLDLLDLTGTGSKLYHEFIGTLGIYTNTFFAYLAWTYFIPRLSTNLFLMTKHIFPWPFMGEHEKALGWSTRLEAQLYRRWSELFNDLVWGTSGVLNCFVLIGLLAPLGFYFTLFAFAFDISNSSLRAVIELGRLSRLYNEYTELLENTNDEDEKKMVRDYLLYILHRRDFEKLRLGLSLSAAISIFFGMCLAIPFLALNPIVPFVGAVIVIITWICVYNLTRQLEQYRPKDNLEKPASVAKLGFFAKNNNQARPASDLSEQDDNNSSVDLALDDADFTGQLSVS